MVWVEWEVWYLNQPGLYYFTVSKKMYYFSVMCSRWLRRAAPDGVSLTAGILDFWNIHCNTDCNGSILWIIKLDGSEWVFFPFGILFIFLLPGDAFLSYISLPQGNWKLWLPRLPGTADAFQDFHSFGCYTVKQKGQNILCSASRENSPKLHVKSSEEFFLWKHKIF